MDINVKINLNEPALLRQQCYIDGHWLDAADGAVIEVNNPASGETIATVPALATGEVRGAIDAANAAWPHWRAMSGKQRCNLLRRWY